MTYQLHEAPRYQPARYGAAQPTVQAVGRPTDSSSRLGAIAVAVIVVIAAVVGFGSDAAATGTVEAISPTSEVSDTIEVYVVQPGDTLWAIAGELALPGEDVRPLVDALQEITNGSDLDIGQRLVIDHIMLRG